MDFYLSILTRLVLACVLGGIIGYEREHTNRPAGFRTHILVCVGATLAMVTSDFIFRTYSENSIDPARLGAQVISGIGFLGAGTIIREGFNVRGLTTAASIWAVACVGLAVGIGFYEGAVGATVVIFITLILLKKIEASFTRKKKCRVIYVKSFNMDKPIGVLTGIFEDYNVKIRKIEFVKREKDNSTVIKFEAKLSNSKKGDVMNGLYKIEGVKEVYEE